MQIHPEKMKAALTMDMLATDIADYLVRKGVSYLVYWRFTELTYYPQVPFRETHHISGRAVALAEKQGCQISDLPFSTWQELSPKFETDVEKVFDFEVSVEKRNAIGGPARAMIQRQVDIARERIEKET